MIPLSSGSSIFFFSLWILMAIHSPLTLCLVPTSMFASFANIIIIPHLSLYLFLAFEILRLLSYQSGFFLLLFYLTSTIYPFSAWFVFENFAISFDYFPFVVRPFFSLVHFSLDVLYLSILTLCGVVNFICWLSIFSRCGNAISFNASFFCTTVYLLFIYFLEIILFNFFYLGRAIYFKLVILRKNRFVWVDVWRVNW